MDQAEFLKKAREGRRMSQAHLAAAAGVSRRTVIRAEQGLEIQDETLRCLCSVLGVDACAVPARSEPEPVTPTSVLRAVIERNGETVAWEGSPDADAWSREVRLDALYGAHAILAFAAAGAGLLYAYVAYLQDAAGAVGSNAFWLGLAGAALSALALRRVFRAVGGIGRSHERARSSLYAVTDQAFYAARYDGWPTSRVGRIERIELPCDRGALRVRSRSPLWPMSRSIRLPVDNGESPGTMHIEAVPDLEGLAVLMRGDGYKAAA